MRRSIVMFMLVLLTLPVLVGLESDSFSPTRPDSPATISDVVYNDTIYVAEYGIFSGGGDEIGDWTNTTAKDGVDWGCDSGTTGTMELQFDCDDSSIAAFDYALYAYVTPSALWQVDIDLYNFTSSGWDEIGEVDSTSYDWDNGTISSSDYWNSTGGIRLRMDKTYTNNDFYWDYAELTFYTSADDLTDYFVTPEQPTEEDEVTFTVVTQPADNISTAYFDAIISPSDYTDQIYYFSENPSYVFTYTFTSLPDGYYLFMWYLKNSTGLKYVFYVPLSVIATNIDISPISFFGVGDDFTEMHISFEINKDCNYTIYESSASVSETDTHNGSVSAGWSNIAWDKLSTTDAVVNFGMKFESGTLFTWINGSYSVAQTTFYLLWTIQRETFDYVTITGRITKTGQYAIYDENDALQSTGTITDLDFKIEFEKWHKKTLDEYAFAIKFTNGSQSCWYNSTYYADDYEAYQGGGVVTPQNIVFDPLFWFGIMIAVTVGSAVAIGVSKATGAGDFPNYPGG